MTDELKGFGLAQLKQEPTEEQWKATLKEASRLWAEQRAQAEKREQDQWLSVTSRAKDMLANGSSLEEVLRMVRMEYESEPEDRDIDQY